jgi:murein DD-endopeptidase MepM/ murein hydrolase activator NlpD
MKKSFVLGVVVLLGLALGLGLVLSSRLDFSGPTIKISPQVPALGVRAVLNLSVTDPGAGVRSVEVDVIQGEKQSVPFKIEYPELGLLKGTGVHQQNLQVVIEPRRLGLAQGPAELVIKAQDASWFRFFSGNVTTIRQATQVDWRPPRIQMLVNVVNINHGGTGLVIYKLDKDAASGVAVGNKFFPGYPAANLGKGVMCSYFAYPADIETLPPGLTVMATDASGNTAKAGFYYHPRDKRFRDDKVQLSDQFLTAKVGELLPTAPPGRPLVTSFLEINRTMRAANHERIRQICQRSNPSQLWQGPFVRPATAPEAAFADRRTYIYNGQEVDRQTHLGVDLASLASAPVQAANSGVVAFADELGIYGNCIIIDHGQGVFSLYGHLSHIAVAAGQRVATSQVIGNTGCTGLAGGDHLHFSILVDGVFVNPIEWWDCHWIKDNVDLKYAQAKEMLAPPPPPPAPPAPGVRPAGVIR